MSWQKREGSGNLVVLGDSEGHLRKVGGLLAAVIPDPRFPDNRRYELVQRSGESLFVAGSAAINSQLGQTDVGKFVKLRFLGWGTGRNGRFKEIEVVVWEGETSGEMKEWPRWRELQHALRPTDGPPIGEPPAEDKEYDDGLPF